MNRNPLFDNLGGHFILSIPSNKKAGSLKSLLQNNIKKHSPSFVYRQDGTNELSSNNGNCFLLIVKIIV